MMERLRIQNGEPKLLSLDHLSALVLPLIFCIQLLKLVPVAVIKWVDGTVLDTVWQVAAEAD